MRKKILPVLNIVSTRVLVTLRHNLVAFKICRLVCISLIPFSVRTMDYNVRLQFCW